MNKGTIQTTIQNSFGQKIAVFIETSTPQIGLLFLMHGFSGFKEQTHIQTIADVFIENGYTVVRFDCRYAFGESDGETIDATETSYYEDLETVIQWAKGQAWYQEPFVLAGHSLGGMTVTRYAETNPMQVKALIPFAPVVSGDLQLALHSPEELKEWKKIGYIETESKSKPGKLKRKSWKLMMDMAKYDLLKKGDALTMPTLLIVGAEDELTPVNQIQMLYEKIPNEKKQLTIVPGAEHTFRTLEHLGQLNKTVSDWICTI